MIITGIHCSSLVPSVKSARYTLMRFWLVKNGVAHVYDVYTVYRGCALTKFKHPQHGSVSENSISVLPLLIL